MIVETLRHSGIRIEELLEISQLSIRQYQRPNGEVVALLVVAPSKPDRERVMPVSPELFTVIAAIIRRHTREGAPVPVVARYDPHERETLPALPYLFQRPGHAGPAVIAAGTVVRALHRLCARIAQTDPEFAGTVFTPHDLRRLFATELVNSGLPIHIGAALLGHLNIQTTRGYVAVFDDDVVRHYQGFLHSRRSRRPADEYRAATDGEWLEFEEHFDRRKVELGNCARPYGTRCQHEHVPLTELTQRPLGLLPRSTDSDSSAGPEPVRPRQSRRVAVWIWCHRLSSKYGGSRRYGCQSAARRSGTLRHWRWPGSAGSRRPVIRCCPSGLSMSRAPKSPRSRNSCTICS